LLDIFVLFIFCSVLLFFSGVNAVKNGGVSVAHLSTASQSSGRPARLLPAMWKKYREQFTDEVTHFRAHFFWILISAALSALLHIFSIPDPGRIWSLKK
jgi:hypothetical protein